MIKVLGLALYGPLAASTRYRLGQYVKGLADIGIDLHIRYLLDDDYLRRRFADSPVHLAPLVQAGARRLFDLWQQDKFDITLLHCELFPLLPGSLEKMLLRNPYIYDFDDAFYLRYKIGKMAIAKPILGSKFETVIRGAAAVNAGSHVLAKYAGLYNPKTSYLPTVVDTDRYFQSRKKRGGRVFTVGWIGSPSTAPYLSAIINPLSTLAKESSVRFVVIGGKAPYIPNVDVIEIAWSESTEIDLINTFDVGVMPLSDDEWARGKCAFKLIQYMACGVPVVASPVGANIDVVSPSCGFLASTANDWVNSLRQLRDNIPLRHSMAEAGRVRVEEDYSLKTSLPKLATVIRNVANL